MQVVAPSCLVLNTISEGQKRAHARVRIFSDSLGIVIEPRVIKCLSIATDGVNFRTILTESLTPGLSGGIIDWPFAKNGRAFSLSQILVVSSRHRSVNDNTIVPNGDRSCLPSPANGQVVRAMDVLVQKGQRVSPFLALQLLDVDDGGRIVKQRFELGDGMRADLMIELSESAFLSFMSKKVVPVGVLDAPGV